MNAPKPVPAVTSVGTATLAVLEVKNAINVAKLDTLLATAPEAITEAAMEVLEVVSRLATPVVGTAIWPATACKARNAITVCSTYLYLSCVYSVCLTIHSIRWRGRTCFSRLSYGSKW